MSVAGLKYDPVLSLDTPAETKSGSYIYSGSAASFHDWEFRTRARVSQHRERQRREVLKDLRSSHQLSRSASPRKWVGGGIRSPDRHTGDESSGMAASPSSAPGRRRGRQAGAESMSSGDGGEEEQQPQDYEVEDDGQASVETEPVPTLASVRDSDLDMSDAVQKTLEGLRGDAFLIARDIGLERLLKHDGIDLLIQKVKDQAFPLQGEEASELFRQGQLLTGPLSKQSGEPMLSYISRRRRWWVTLRELDPEVRLSEAMRANLLVELSGLSRQEQLMVRAAAQAETVDAYARVLIKHHSVVHMRERLLVEKDKPVARTWSKPRWENTSFQQKPRYGYMTQGFMEDDEYEYQGLGSQAYVAEEHEVEEDEGEWVDDSALALALNAYTAMQTELGGEPGEEHAEALQLAYAAQTTLANVKGNKGAEKSASPGKPGMASSSQAYLAALSDASDDETPAIHLSNTSRDMEGYPAERSGGPSERPRVRRSEATAMRDSPPPGSDTLFTFGHHKGLTYERVLHTYPGYVLWGQTQKCPSKCLGDFLNWVHEHCVVEDTDPIEVRRRDIPLSTMMPPTSVADRAANAEGTASSSTGFRPKCRGGCKTFSKTGSNSYIDMRTCKSCGTVTKTRKEQVQVDPTTCTHAQVDRSGSSKTTSRIKCKLCGMILDELPQEEKKARDAAAAQLRDTNTLDFDMMRSIVGRTGDRVPVEVVVPALEQFKEAVEGHFVTEPSITRGDLFAYLQEALDDHADDASPTSASWEMASSGRRPGTAMVAMLAEPHEGVTDTNPSLSKLPVVNIRTSPHVFAVLDEGCNSTVHGEDWGHESMSKYASFGYSTRFAKETSKTFKGLSGENTNLTAAMAIAPSQRPAPKARPQQLNSETFPTEGGDNPKHAADIFTFGYNFEEAVDKIRNAWEPQHFADMFSEMRSAEATLELGGAFVGIFFDLTYLPNARSLGPELADRKRDTSLRDHVGSHPSIMKAIAADPGFLQHCRAIRSKVKKSMEQGYQAMNISVVCKQNRHRSVAGGILIEHMLLRVEGLHVSMQHCNSEQSWPLMGGSCRGHCSWCTHRTDDAKAAYEQVLADFIKYLEGDVKENTTCILHCESEPERAPGTAPEEVTDLDADDEVEEVPSDPLEVAPGEGESASQAATRLGLRGKQHTSYVAKWDPSSLTGRLHQQAGSGVFTATSSHLPVQAQVQTLERKLALRDKEVESLRSKLRDAERDKQEAERRAERAEQLLQDALAQFGGRSRSRHRHHDRRARSSSSDSRRKVRRERSSHHDDHRAQSSRRESSSYRDRDRDQWHPSSSYRDTARETSSYDQNQWDAWDDEWSRAGDWDHQAPPEPPKPPVRRWRELKNYFHDPAADNSNAAWAQWRKSQGPAPPGEGKRIKLDPAILALDLTEIPTSDDASLSWNRRVLVDLLPDQVMHEFCGLLYGRPSPALWIGPYMPKSFSTQDLEHTDKSERHNFKVTAVTPHTREGYKPCGNVKGPTPIGWLFLNDNPKNKGGVWIPQGTVCPPGHSTEDVCGEFKAEQVCPTEPPPSGGAYLVLWLYPKAFAPDTVPKTLADRDELSAYMASLQGVNDFGEFKQVRFDAEDSDDEFELIPAHDGPRAITRVISETIANLETGVPGLIVLRVDAPTEELCLECECLADTAGVSIVLVSPYGCPTLESTVEVRGDLNVSGIGPNIDDALQVLSTWTESYGMSPRCYADTEEHDFWATCRDISQELYLNSYTRNCFVGSEGLGSDMEDQVLRHRRKNAEQHGVRKVLEQVLRQSKASKEFILAARLHRCKACLDTAPVPRHHPVSGESVFPKEFNHTLGIDCMEVKDVDGTRYTAVNMVDMGTSFQQVALIKSGGGNPSARQCLQVFMERWVSWAGHPQHVVVDRGTHFKGEFASYMGQHGIHLRNAPLESPQTIGKVERHGGLLKALVRKTVQEIQPSTWEDMVMVVSECVTTKNDLSRHQGFSPSQHVLGKRPRTPGSVMDEDESMGPLLARFDETTPFYSRHRAREEARKAFVHLDSSRKVARALQRNAAPMDMEYQVGDLVIYRRDNLPGSTSTVWSTASRVIGREAENAYWLLHEGVPVLVNARKMRPADEVEVAACRVLTGEPVLPGSIVHGPEQRYLDERDKDPVTAPSTPRPNTGLASAPSTPMRVAAAESPAITSKEISPSDKTGRERTRSPLRQSSSALMAEAQDTDPVEAKASELLEAMAFETSHCLELLRLCKEHKPKRTKRAMFQDATDDELAASFGVYRHGGFVGISNPTKQRPCFVTYLNRFLRHHCEKAGYTEFTWNGIQVSESRASLHKDNSNLKGSLNFTMSLGNYSKGGHLWIENPEGNTVIDVCGNLVPGTLHTTRGKVLRFDPKKLHMVEPHEGQRFSIIGFTMNHLGKLRADEHQMMEDLEFPQPRIPSPQVEQPRQEEPERADDMHSSDDEEVGTGFLASLLDYHNSPAEVQLGLDEAMLAEWAKYQEFHAVIPCSKKQVQELLSQGHICVPTKWVLTDKHEHLKGTPGYRPKYKARLVACGNFEHISTGEDIRADSPTAEPEALAFICSWASSLGLRIKAADITNAYFQGKPLERLLILKAPSNPKGVPDKEIQESGYMIARVPVYGTTDAGRNLYLRIVEETKCIGLKSSQIMSALYYAHDTSGRLCAMLCTHVDDFFWAAFGEGELKIQQLLDHFKIGRIEEGSFRFCGREYAQHPDGTIEINSRDNTRAIAPLEIPKGAKLTTPVTQGQRTALRSVIGSLAWVARATRPDLAHRVNALQQRVTVATIDTMREANRVVALALGDAERSIVYRAKILPWSSGPLAVVTFCDASFAAEAGYKSQRGRLHYLTDAETARDVNAPKHKLHLVAFGSSTMKRVCRATLQCEAYSLQHATEHGDRIRATLLELQGKLPSLHDWSEVAPRKMLHLQYSDCRSLTDHLLSSVPRPVEDKRLAIEMTALRQALWVDETPTSEAFAPFGDILRWIPTHLQLADCLTKSMKPKLLNDALESNEAVVREEAPAE
ncbi:RE2 [Symbiodinium natans]|uniref:RE2 protein n=1 Tax=Symbiodinium natans TaxID=878477 RepID=A0A812MCS6_9DINO|nr:RE2 [Symbiodinium natans]